MTSYTFYTVHVVYLISASQQKRHRGAEAKVPSQAVQRRARGRAGHVRARLGVGRRLHVHPRREGRRPLRTQRLQGLWLVPRE